MTTKWQGLWAQERPGFYAGQVLKKADIPKYTRIVLRYNKFYEKDGNRPRFVYCFADSEGYADKCVPLEYEEEESSERLFTREEVRKIINGTVDAVKYGITDPFDILPEDFV